jgi:hypothetical protein
MKGIVFAEFIEMVETKFGFETADAIITKSNLDSGGSYTSVGTYPHEEMVQLVVQLSKETQTEIPALLEAFGLYLFERFSKLYGVFFENKNNAFDFLMGIEDYIHVEVKKLYPDAQLPTIEAKITNKNTMELLYRSERKMADLACGLIKGCALHFGEKISIRKENQAEDGSAVRFELTKE